MSGCAGIADYGRADFNLQTLLDLRPGPPGARARELREGLRELLARPAAIHPYVGAGIALAAGAWVGRAPGRGPAVSPAVSPSHPTIAGLAARTGPPG